MKWAKKIVLWDHFCQVIFILSAFPSIILAIRGKGTFLSGLVIGWNFGCAFYWQIYLRQRNQTDKWFQRALRSRQGEVEHMLEITKSMVEARIRSHDIDPDRN